MRRSVVRLQLSASHQFSQWIWQIRTEYLDQIFTEGLLRFRFFIQGCNIHINECGIHLIALNFKYIHYWQGQRRTINPRISNQHIGNDTTIIFPMAYDFMFGFLNRSIEFGLSFMNSLFPFTSGQLPKRKRESSVNNLAYSLGFPLSTASIISSIVIVKLSADTGFSSGNSPQPTTNENIKERIIM